MNNWKEFVKTHRYGLMGTVIFHLLLLIVLVSVGISRERERQVMEVVMDLPTEEETEQTEEPSVAEEPTADGGIAEAEGTSAG